MRRWMRWTAYALVVICGAGIVVLASVGELRPALALWIVVVTGLALGVLFLVLDLELQQVRDEIRRDVERAIREIRSDRDR